jgi:indole-3-glycerol phosphate synthase
VAVPLLRKDFIVTRYQLLEAREAGADAVLLIAAALDGAALGELLGLAAAEGLAALVEVHDERELGRALDAGASVVGVNSRNLRTLEVDLGVPRRLAGRIPSSVVAVAESGLRTRADLEEMSALGYRAFLIGERFMTAPDPGAALGELRRALQGSGRPG